MRLSGYPYKRPTGTFIRYVDSAHNEKPSNKSLFKSRLNKETSMATACVFLVFHSADLTTVEDKQQIPNLPFPPTRLKEKDDGEDDGTSDQEGREELYQHHNKVI